MKKSKKFLCLLLALVMAGSLLLLPAAAANTQSGATRYPTVYVHGLMGWGEHDQIYSAVPYWGRRLRRPALERVGPRVRALRPAHRHDRGLRRGARRRIWPRALRRDV